MIDRSLFANIDWILIGLLVINSLIGMVLIYSSSHYLPGDYHLRQFVWIAVGLVMMLALLAVDYHALLSHSFYFYGICILFLGGILIFGNIIAGTKSWIKLPFFQIQPSEITKLAVILVLAQIFSEHKKRRLGMFQGIMGLSIIALPILLVALQPDLGTALGYLPILLGALILAGLNRKILILILIVAVLLGIVGWNLLLRDYQKQRVLTLLNPEHDPLGSGYHILQSKIAIGSGGLLGKGLTRGTQSQLRFLPARHTDFIFSVLGEELGFLGIIVVLLLYFLFLSRLFLAIEKSRDRAGIYIIYMVAVMITTQFFINILMTAGLFPVTGIPLPLISYGGSSLLTNYLAVSLVLNVKIRRFVNI